MKEYELKQSNNAGATKIQLKFIIQTGNTKEKVYKKLKMKTVLK